MPLDVHVDGAYAEIILKIKGRRSGWPTHLVEAIERRWQPLVVVWMRPKWTPIATLSNCTHPSVCSETAERETCPGEQVEQVNEQATRCQLGWPDRAPT